MDSDISIDFCGDFLRAALPPGYEITPGNAAMFWSQIGEACKKYNCHRILAEGKISSRKMTLGNAYDAGEQAGDFAPLRLVCLFDDYSPDEMTDFFKTVASNRGVLIEFFTDRNEALNWLGVDSNQ